MNKITWFLKLFAIVFTMTQGIFFTLAFLWFMAGLPVDTYTIAMLYAIAVFIVSIFVIRISSGGDPEPMEQCRGCAYHDVCSCWKREDGAVDG